MTAHDADIEVLRETYADVAELDRRPEGARYSAALPDGAPVVLLVLARELSDAIRSDESFFATLERAAAVHHEALVGPLAWGRGGNGLLHCAYPRLDTLDVAPGTLSPVDVATNGVQLARALSAAHAAGLPHGAIASIQIAHTAQHGAQLNGFGLFAALCAGGVDVREAALVLSEAPYVSPEVQNGAMPDERSDIFSLGASLYELLTGKPPYGGRTTAYVMAAVLSDPESERDAQDRRAGPVVDALVRAIEQAPEDRWPTATAFANALASGAVRSQSSAAKRRARGCLPTAAVLCLAIVELVGRL